MLIAPYDCADERGVWIKEITSQQLTRDRSGVVMKVFVPWSAIQALGVVDEECGKVQVGFPATNAWRSLSGPAPSAQTSCQTRLRHGQ